MPACAKLDEPGRCESYASILGRAGRDELSVEAAAPPPLEVQNYSMHSYGAQFCEVRVNAVTGETRVTASSARSTAGASSTRRLRPASSAAASSWASAWR